MKETVASAGMRAIAWESTGDAEFPYVTRIDNEVWRIRVNDFPAQPLYTLFVGDRVVGSFDDWPRTWIKGQAAARP